MTDTVTGRTYTATRVRGFAPWSPRPDTLALLDVVNGILREYAAQLPMTNRQIFYRLVGAHGYEKTEQAYARLCEYLNRARRARIIRFGAIRDDGTDSQGGPGWRSPASFWHSVRFSADRYHHDETDGQPYYCELWVEAGGMLPQAARVSSPYGITAYSAGGFNGLTDKYETAERIAREDKPVIIFHVGDYDPSGCAIIDSLAADINAFVEELAPWQDVDWRRIVVTPEQIERYSLPTAPQKRTDVRGERMDDTVQAEALPPDVLADVIDAAIAGVIDQEAAEVARALGERERAEILGVLGDLTGEES
ncbi:MAG TPA: hypothetical protein VIX86_11645 [Streptosporangiaceae bacterium]